MREFAYRNDGIPRDVIQSPVSSVLQNAHYARSSYKRNETEREGGGWVGRTIKELNNFLNCAYKYSSLN